MQVKYNWSANLMDRIWWRPHGNTLIVLTPNSRQIIQKFLFDYWATNSREAKLYKYRSPICERCNNYIETCDHVIRCPDVENRSLWYDMLEKMREFFHKSKTPPGIELSIIAGLQAWYMDQNPPAIEEIVPRASYNLRQAYEEQNRIGWRHFLRGRISLLWAHLINFEIDMSRQNRQQNKFRYQTAESWAKKLFLIQWAYILQMWEVRNKAVQKQYIDIGKNRETEFLKDKAKQHIESILVDQDSDDEELQHEPEEVETMGISTLKVFVQNLEKLKRWVKAKINF